ncbi:MAG TPA: hypothetical protein VK356_00855 [Thermomicrobiales bacterium]|nr:hypothetical protein [Thermomicrobiales bacterium]
MLPKLSLRAIESASFVALVTAILYFMGYSYYAGFFERISLPPPFPELSTSDYFVRAFSSLSGLLAAALVSVPYRSTVPTTIWQAVWVNAPFTVVPLILGQNARSSGFLDQDLALILGAVAAVGVIASLLKQSGLRLLTARWGLSGMLAYALGIFLFFGAYFRLEGSADATRFIEGRLQPSSTIVLETRDPESPVNGVPLLVALARGGFYLVKQTSPAPVAPVVYFVPESEVLTATMQRAGAATATPTPSTATRRGSALAWTP